MAPAPTYTVAPAPRHAGMMNWDCTRCGRAEVRPVFLTGNGGTAAYGSGCAARLLGWFTPSGTPRASDVKLAAAAAERRALELAAMRADRMAWNALALAASTTAEPDMDEVYRARKHEALRHLGGPVAGFRPAFHQALSEGATDGAVIVATRTAELLGL